MVRQAHHERAHHELVEGYERKNIMVTKQTSKYFTLKLSKPYKESS